MRFLFFRNNSLKNAYINNEPSVISKKISGIFDLLSKNKYAITLLRSNKIIVGAQVIDQSLLSKVNLFLLSFKRCALDGRVDFSEVNVKTTKFLRTIGVTNRGMNRYILENIAPKHYFRGPSSHHRFADRTVMEFGMNWEQVKLYMKLELIVDDNECVVGYMSFHPRE